MTLLRRALDFLIGLAIVLFVAWILTKVVELFPIIPGGLKDIVVIIIWFVAFIITLILAKRTFVDGTPILT